MQAKWRHRLRHWHRRLGMVAAAFALWLALSGLLVQHAGDLGLDRRALSPALLQFYGVKIPPAQGLQMDGRWWLGQGGTLYRDGRRVAECERLVGGVRLGEERLLACSERLVWFTAEGVLIEQLDRARGLHGTVAALGVLAEQPVIRVGERVLRIDVMSLGFQPITGRPQWSAVVVPPAAVQARLPAPQVAGLNWARFWQDAHSGRLFGPAGVIVVDLAALALGLLAVSGWIASRRPRA